MRSSVGGVAALSRPPLSGFDLGADLQIGDEMSAPSKIVSMRRRCYAPPT
jgi:hypothetical protein